MRADIRASAVYPHPRGRVWAALTSADALSQWLMATDFQPVVGHRFTFRTDPGPGFDGTVHCQVLEIDEPSRMVWSWRGGPVDTTVTITLDEVDAEHTRLHLEQAGFHGLGAQFARLVLRGGWAKLLHAGLPSYLDHIAGRPVDPVAPRPGTWRHLLTGLRPSSGKQPGPIEREQHDGR